MSYTFLAARYANAEQTAAVAETEEAASVALSAVDTPEDWAALMASGIPIAPYEQPEPPLGPLTARQLRLGLVAAGFSLGDVEAAIDAIEDQTDREVARIEWEYATTFERSHPLIEQVGAALGLTPEQIDAMWAEAATL